MHYFSYGVGFLLGIKMWHSKGLSHEVRLAMNVSVRLKYVRKFFKSITACVMLFEILHLCRDNSIDNEQLTP